MGELTEHHETSTQDTRSWLVSWLHQNAPGCLLLSRCALIWMLFTLFVAGLCVGLILGKHLA